MAIAVVAGLMAMHGFGTHGSHAAATSRQAHHAAHAMVGHTPEPSTGSTLSTMSKVAETTLPSASGTLLEAVASPLTSDSGGLGGSGGSGVSGGSGGASLLGLCLALLTVGLTWLLSRSGSRVAWTVPRLSTALRREALPATAHTLDPPSRAELCIWRC